MDVAQRRGSVILNLKFVDAQVCKKLHFSAEETDACFVFLSIYRLLFLRRLD